MVENLMENFERGPKAEEQRECLNKLESGEEILFGEVNDGPNTEIRKDAAGRITDVLERFQHPDNKARVKEIESILEDQKKKPEDKINPEN